MRDAGCDESDPGCDDWVASLVVGRSTFGDMRKLERYDAWRTAQELAYQAYLLTLNPHLSKHFALIDQIRRAALSVPT